MEEESQQLQLKQPDIDLDINLKYVFSPLLWFLQRLS
jgi:hypothetical protein